MILALRTDNPRAELYIINDGRIIAEYAWEAHRQLADTIHYKIEELLHSQNLSWYSIKGVIVFKGPGSFTGLRIGISVANTLAYANTIPIVGTIGDDWLQDGIIALSENRNHKIVLPEYGGKINITTPKK